MIVGILKETFAGERRVALIPSGLPALSNAGFTVRVESGAGLEAGFTDEMYKEQGAVISDRDEVFAKADVLLQVRVVGCNPDSDAEDLKKLGKGKILIGLLDALTNKQAVNALALKGVKAFALELVPRITRAQSMDVLSSQANIAGYKAALIAAQSLARMFPMMMTAAGTITPARVFVVGAGVAGLQAIATCNRLGAVVSAYDVRPAVKEQVQSLGAKFVELELEAGDSEDEGGYAKEMDEEFYKKQQDLMAKVIAESDAVITTAAIPGRKAPILVTKEMVAGMGQGSVIVDLAAESGGNCEFTEAGKTIRKDGVTVIGPQNVPSSVPYHASQMYSKNIANLLLLMVKDEKLYIDLEDEILRETLITDDGKVVNDRVRESLRL